VATPTKRESKTFLLTSANRIATKEGNNDKYS
jgi:hypothetical protein